MVKLGSNLPDKMEKQPSADDGFDNIPLITPLEVSQLQQPFADKVSPAAFVAPLFILFYFISQQNVHCFREKLWDTIKILVAALPLCTSLLSLLYLPFYTSILGEGLGITSYYNTSVNA